MKPESRGFAPVEVRNSGRESFERRVRRDVQRLRTITEIHDPNHNLDEVAKRIKDGAYPVFYANHTHHANIEGFMGIVRKLKGDRPQDIIVPIARSLVVIDEKGKNQDEDLIKFANAMKPELAKLGMRFVEINRPKDINMLLGIEDPNAKITASVIRQASAEVREVLRRGNINKDEILSTVASRSSGCMVFPEGTTTGGTRKEGGARTGMIKVELNLFKEFIDESIKDGREIVFIPVGMNGYNYIIEPRSSGYSRLKFGAWVARNKVTNFFRVELPGPGEKPAKVVVGMPFGLKELRQEGLIDQTEKKEYAIHDGQMINKFFMGKVAKNLTPDLQGVYSIAA